MNQITTLVLTVLLVMQSSLASAQTPETKASTPTITRIVFLGDSIKAGVGVQDSAKERYSTVTTRLLAGKYDAITEINLGQSGSALCQQGAGYSDSVLKQNPDAVVIQWGANDQYWGFSVSEFVARYDALVAALRAAKPRMRIVVMTLVADFRWADNQDAWIGEANVALQEIAARYRCHLADTHRAIDHQKKYFINSAGCMWCGASWPFSTAQTLTALANVLNNYKQDVVEKKEYFETMKAYTRSHRLKLVDGKVVSWLDESLNPDTGRGMKVGPFPKTRGRDHNHSSYCDLIISGLVGLRPQADELVEVNPLVPEGALDYFCLDNVSYHSRNLTVFYDKTGKRYGRGTGLHVLADGREIAHGETLTRVTGNLPNS